MRIRTENRIVACGNPKWCGVRIADTGMTKQDGAIIIRILLIQRVAFVILGKATIGRC